MTNAQSLLRSLVVYAICLPLAILLGYMLTDLVDRNSYSVATVVLVLGFMMIPLFLRWHYPWMLLAWNSVVGFYFMKGNITLWMVMIVISFGISFLTYVMNRSQKFIYVPSVVWPLFCIVAVVTATGLLTHSFGLHMFGSETMGGKRYLFLFLAIVGFFALTAKRIPREKAGLYVSLYFLGAMTNLVGTLASIISPNSLYFIFYFFPADMYALETFISASFNSYNRLNGVAAASQSVLSALLARHGLTGMLSIVRIYRPLLLIGLVILSMFGGFRATVITLILIFGLQFCLEGLLRTRLLPAFILIAIFGGALVIPFSTKLPLSVQRSLTFLPPEMIDLDLEARLSAEDSTTWRVTMWKSILPEVPQYLLLGKGLGIDANEMDMATRGLGRGFEVAGIASLASDFHSGPLSLIIPFGLPGTFAFLWFLIAGYRVMYRNYRHGDPALERINRYLFTFYIVKIFMFFVVFGCFYSDLIMFVGPVGLSIALNGGVCSPAVEPVAQPQPAFNRFRLAQATR